MKNYIYIVSVFILCISCEMGLDDLPAHDEGDVENFFVEYRYTYLRSSDQKEVVKRLFFDTTVNIDEDLNTVDVTTTVPPVDVGNNFTTQDRDNVNLTNIIGFCDISVAAKIEPLDGAPLLGVPGDFSSPVKYKITAANGFSKEWTIAITLIK